MPYTTLHFAPTLRGTGDGSTAANAAAFSGNWPSLLTSNNYATSGIVALMQNTGTYTLSQQGTTAVFSGGAPTSTTYSLLMLAADSSGNPIEPANYGWKCSEGDLVTTGFASINYTLTTGALVNATNIHFNCFVITATNASAAIFLNFAGLLSWCDFRFTSTSSSGLGITFTTTSPGMADCQISMTGASWARIITASTAGMMSNVRVKGDATATTGTMYGIAVTSNAIISPTNGPVFVVDCQGAGIINYGVSSNTGISVSRATVVNCGIGIGTLVATSGGFGRVICTDSVITGCVTGLNQAYGHFTLSNTVLRNNSNYSVTPEGYTGTPRAYITAEADAEIYAAPLSGDYRIKSTSAHWGKNRGANLETVVDNFAIGVGVGKQIARAASA